jgi:hypothetical protein
MAGTMLTLAPGTRPEFFNASSNEPDATPTESFPAHGTIDAKVSTDSGCDE